jgi:hypothetical protein
MTVPVQTPVANHIGNGVTTAFAYGFKLLDESDIVVSVDGVEKTLDIDFSIAGVGVESGGTVTFAVAPAALSEVALVRQVALNRLTDYQYAGDFESPTVNRDFDRLVMMLQDSGLALANTIRLPPGDASDGVLPSASNRALKGLAFDADGNVILTVASDATALAAALASPGVVASTGAGIVSFNDAAPYAAGTTGQKLQLLDAELGGVISDLGDGTFPPVSSVTNAKLSDMAAATLKGRATGAGTGAPVDLTAAQARTILNGTAWDLAVGTVDLTKSLTGAVAPSPPLNITVTDTLNIAGNFAFGAAILVNRTGGTGHREAATARITSNGAPASEFCVGFHGLARVQTGSGNAFGLNGYAWVDAAALATAEICGGEMNTDARRSVNRKVGLQVVDVATSTGAGTAYDAGVIIGRQAGGNGYNIGISFGFDGTTGFGVQTGGTFISAPTSVTSFRAGLDLAGISTWSVAPILLRPNSKGIWWGTTAEGGSVISETATGGGVVTFLNAETRVKFGATNVAAWTIRDTFLIVRTGADGAEIFRRLIAGAADSGGAGYRALRVEN